MKAIIIQILQSIFSLLGKERKSRLITNLATICEINLLGLAYRNIGVLNGKSLVASGEEFVINQVLKEKLMGKSQPIFFDVGANIGNYSLLLSETYPHAIIYTFEPNAITFNSLRKNIQHTQNIRIYNQGFSNQPGNAKIYTYEHQKDSGHASLYSSAFDLHKSQDILAVDVELTTLALFCEQNNITSIDFLKIDTEGHEFSVLKGAEEMIRKGKIKIIQFEFNEMNVVSRVFLKDFFDLLKDYKIFRMNTNSLIPLLPYDVRNEIFKFQNILTIHHSVGG